MSLFTNPAFVVNFFPDVYSNIIFLPLGNVNIFLQYLVSILLDRFVHIFLYVLLRTVNTFFPLYFMKKYCYLHKKSINVLSQPTALLTIIFR